MVRVGSRRFAVVEPPGSSAGVVRVGSLCLNHPELVQKHPTHYRYFLELKAHKTLS